MLLAALSLLYHEIAPELLEVGRCKTFKINNC